MCMGYAAAVKCHASNKTPQIHTHSHKRIQRSIGIFIYGLNLYLTFEINWYNNISTIENKFNFLYKYNHLFIQFAHSII